MNNYPQVGDRFIVVSIQSPFYGERGKALYKPNNNGIVSAYLDKTGDLVQRLNMYDLHKIHETN